MALAAVVHRHALRVIHDAHYGSPININININITANPQDRLEQYAPEVAEAPAAVAKQQKIPFFASCSQPTRPPSSLRSWRACTFRMNIHRIRPCSPLPVKE